MAVSTQTTFLSFESSSFNYVPPKEKNSQIAQFVQCFGTVRDLFHIAKD